MQEGREQFVEPEIVKHQEKLADVTAQPVGYADGTFDDFTDASPTRS